MKRPSDYPSYLALRAALAAVRVLPRPLALGAGGALGGVIRLMGMRRAVTDENLAKAFPAMSPPEREQLARAVYRHFGRMAVDSMRFSSDPRGVIPLVHDTECIDLIRERLKRGRGVILLSGHIGNWELAGAYLASIGIPLAGVVKPPANPHVAAYTERVRRSLGIETIPMPEARTRVPEALRQNRLVGLVADQGALRSTTWVPFFGQPTRTPAGPAVFASRSGAPVLFGTLLADERGYRAHVEVLEEEVSDDASVAVPRVAARFRERLEAVVRRTPEQYLWSHRLWKSPPPPPEAPPAPDAP